MPDFSNNNALYPSARLKDALLNVSDNLGMSFYDFVLDETKKRGVNLLDGTHSYSLEQFAQVLSDILGKQVTDLIIEKMDKHLRRGPQNTERT